MDNNNTQTNDAFVIDYMHIIKSVLKRIWLVALVSVITAAAFFAYAKFGISPQYSSSVLLYVNNSAVSVGDLGVRISSSDLSASQSLVKTYSVLLKNRTTLSLVKDLTGTNYSWQQLNGMVKASSEDETEIMKITVTTPDPYESKLIANGIAEVLPERVSEIVEGSSVEVVDSAVANTSKVSPNVTSYTSKGFIIGFVLSVAFLVVLALLDNTIHDEDFIVQNFNSPILAKIPNLLGTSKDKYKYRYYYYRKKSDSSKTNADNKSKKQGR